MNKRGHYDHKGDIRQGRPKKDHTTKARRLGLVVMVRVRIVKKQLGGSKFLGVADNLFFPQRREFTTGGGGGGGANGNFYRSTQYIVKRTTLNMHFSLSS